VEYVDDPITSDEDDCFAFSRYRDALLQVVRSSGTPLTIGVFGPWGSGKTSLLKLIQQEFDRQSGLDHLWLPVTVWFNAWQYGRDEALWRALILTILDSLRGSKQPELENDEALTQLKSASPEDDELDRIESSLYRTVEWEQLGKWTIEWPQALEGTIRGATRIALSFIPGAAPVASAIEHVLGELRGDATIAEQIDRAANAIRRQVQTCRREQIRSLEQFQRGFEALIQSRFVKAEKTPKRLVVFIDDLDRCLPEKAIEVLEAIKLFLNVEGCYFFLAADRDVIEKGIRVKYQGFLLDPSETHSDEDVARRIPITGRDYIEKIIQVPFSLSPLERPQVVQYIEQIHPELACCAQVCAAGLEPNPRKVKRALNLLSLLLNLTPDDIDQELLAKLVVIQSRYPDLYAQLFDYPGLLQELERFFLKSGDTLPTSKENGQPETLFKLRDRYIHHKAMRDMLCQGPLFQELPREQLETYLYLTRATSEDKRIVQATTSETPLWDKLRSADLTQISDAVERIQAAAQSDQYATQIGAMLERDDLRPQERFSLGLAWGQLGYPEDLDEWVTVPDTSFRIGKYLVTNKQFQRFIQSGSYEEPDYWGDDEERVLTAKKARYWDDPRWNQPMQPVVGVSWYVAQAYCRWLSQREGKLFRLPTEEEWLRAATGLPELPADPEQIPAYPWGPEFTPNKANTSQSGLGVTTPVGCYPSGARPNGALDLSGNVWEWMDNDGYRPGSKAMRGGSWRDGFDKARWDAREDALPTFQADFVGFRALIEL
jgi:hypothetical protein